MPEERVTRSTTTVSSSTNESEELKERLTNVQGAIQEIEQQVRRDAESLQKLRDMLDVSYLEEITTVIQDLESRIHDVADEAEQAEQRAAEAEEALKEEQQRLEKLWDVYKVQEEELEQAKADNQDLRSDLAGKEDRIEILEDELEAEERALRQAQSEMGDLREQLANAEAKAEELKAYEQLGDQVDDLENQLEEERERLAKLYAVYEEAQAERDDLSAQVKQWERWFESHKESMRGTGRAVNEAPSK